MEEKLSGGPQPAFNVTIKHLRAFIALCEFRSFTRAAAMMNLSQPSMTMAIQQLEDIFSTPLFERTTRSVTLTDEAADFLPAARRIVQDFDLAIQNMRVQAALRRGHIGIAAVHSVATRLMPSVLRELAGTQHGLHVLLRDGNSADVRQRVRRNEVDIGFASREDEDPELEFTPLFRDRLVLLGRRDHPVMQDERDLRWAELAGHDFVGLTADTATAPIMVDITDLPATVAHAKYEASTNATLWAMVGAGIAISTTAALAVAANDLGDLRFRQLSKPEAWRYVYAVTRRGRPRSELTQTVIERVRTELESRYVLTGLIETL